MDICKEIKKQQGHIHHLMEEILAEGTEEERRMWLGSHLADTLVPLMRAEEGVLYNSLRLQEATKEEILSGFKNHVEMEVILRGLQLKDKLDLDWQSSAVKLQELIQAYIHFDEDVIFPLVRAHLTVEESFKLGEAFKESFEHLKKDGILKSSWEMMMNLVAPSTSIESRVVEENP